MEETTLHRSQPRAHPWGWAFCCSILTHAGLVLAVGLYITAPQPPMNLPEAIKVELVSMPAAPKAVKLPTPPPIVQKPVTVPPVQKPRPVIQKKPKPTPAPKPVVIPDPEPVIVSQQTETQIAELERSISAESDQSPQDDLLAPEAEEVPVASLAEAGDGAAQIPVTTAQNSTLQNYSNLIRERIDKVKRYPLMARKAGKQGTVVVEFKVNRQGELLESQVVNSCGTKALDKAALKALNQASPFARLPDNLKSPHTFNLQINFFLEG